MPQYSDDKYELVNLSVGRFLVKTCIIVLEDMF